MIRCFWCRDTIAEFVEKRAIIRCTNKRCNRLNVIDGQYYAKVVGLATPNRETHHEEVVTTLTQTG